MRAAQRALADYSMEFQPHQTFPAASTYSNRLSSGRVKQIFHCKGFLAREFQIDAAWPMEPQHSPPVLTNTSERPMNRGHADALPEMAQTNVMVGPTTAGAIFLPFAVARRALATGFETLLLWQERASERHYLSMMEDHMRKDIGFSCAEIEREIRKPFWRP